MAMNKLPMFPFLRLVTLAVYLHSGNYLLKISRLKTGLHHVQSVAPQGQIPQSCRLLIWLIAPAKTFWLEETSKKFLFPQVKLSGSVDEAKEAARPAPET